MVSLIVALIAYIGSLSGSRILHVQAHHNSDLAESFINKISLLLGTLSLILEVVILVPSLGLVAGFFWVVWFVKVVAECEYLKTLYENAAASVSHTFGKLKDYLNMIIQHFATEPREQNDELSQATSMVYRNRYHSQSCEVLWVKMKSSSRTGRSRKSRQKRYTKVHNYICSLIAILGGFLQLKQGARNESLFNTNYPAMVSLIVGLIAYIGSLIGSRILHVQARHNSDLVESFINKISLLLGTLSLILEVVILVPSLGLVVAECKYLKTLYENAAASVSHTFSKLKDYLNMIIQHFATKPREQNDELPQATSVV
ncbi:unnamed protein product [Malus baccata var. baccata]